jgi:hypothetical protein
MAVSTAAERTSEGSSQPAITSAMPQMAGMGSRICQMMLRLTNALPVSDGRQDAMRTL